MPAAQLMTTVPCPDKRTKLAHYPKTLMTPLLEHLLFPPITCVPPEKRQMPSFEYPSGVEEEKRYLQLLWYEYKQANPEGYQHSQFCHLYRQWAGKLDICLRQTYRAGEKLLLIMPVRPYLSKISSQVRPEKLNSL